MSASEAPASLHSITHTSPTNTITNSHNMFFGRGLQSSHGGWVSGNSVEVDRQILRTWVSEEVADDLTEVLSCHSQGYYHNLLCVVLLQNALVQYITALLVILQ